MILEKLKVRAIAIDHGGTPRFEPPENLGLRVGDFRDRAEETEMDRRDRGDDGDMGPREPRQRIDLARVVHAELEHAEAHVFRYIGERQRNAPMVVERLGRGMHRTARAERKAQSFLGAGLARAPRYGDDLGAARALARRTAEAVQGFERIADAHETLLIGLREGVVDDGASGAFFESGGDKGMTVPVRSADRDEGVVRSERAAIDGAAGDWRRGRAERRAARGLRDLAEGPERFSHRSPLA